MRSQAHPSAHAHQALSARRLLSLLLIVSICLVAGLATPPAAAQTTPCQLVPALAMFRDLVGRDRVGECNGPATRATDTNDVNQPTTRGTLTLRAADLVALFNDGQTTWLYGPRGLESRPSMTRLPWEPPIGPGTPQSSSPSSIVQGPAPLAVASPAPLPPPIDQSVKLEGSSSQSTEPFDLAGGEYNVAWTARIQNGNSSCYVGSWIRRDGDLNPGNLLLHTNLNNKNDRSTAGETRLFGVAPGRYVLDVMTTGCDWSFELTTRH